MSEAVEIAALDADQYRDLLRSAPGRLIAGGRVYDALIVACAVAVKADVILTFNEQHFRPLAASAIEIVVPR